MRKYNALHKASEAQDARLPMEQALLDHGTQPYYWPDECHFVLLIANCV